jgi:2C-methyl-D-erythritol 2,4-cyclodiphosphate synthase
MRSPTRWLATLATSGIVAGGAVALTHSTPDRGTTVDASAQTAALRTPTTTTETGSLTAANLNVQLLLNEANQLQTAITTARNTLARSLSSTDSTFTAAATTTSVPTTTGSSGPSNASLQTQSQQLSAEEAAVSAQRQQLANEAAQLGTESQQLSSEQTQLQQEAAALAAAEAQQAATTTTTSGRGTKNGSNGD